MTVTARRRSGFTLLELVVVIIVLGLLAGIVAPQIINRLSEAKSTTAKTQIELLSVALDGYRLDNGSYPTTEQGLAALRVRVVALEEPALSGAFQDDRKVFSDWNDLHMALEDLQGVHGLRALRVTVNLQASVLHLPAKKAAPVLPDMVTAMVE